VSDVREPDDRPVVAEPRLRRRRRHRRSGRNAIVLAVVLTAALIAATTAVALVVVAEDPSFIPACRLSNQKLQPVAATSLLTAADRSPLGALPAVRQREPVPMTHMSPWLPRASIAIEDRRFWHHGALDYPGIVRAAIANIRHGHTVQGGSTITQQLVRVRYLGPAPVTVARKLKEACLAIGVAHATPKRRVLEAYLNNVFYGHGAYGVEAASRIYFSRPSGPLKLSQAALLAGLPQAPTVYDPLAHPKAALTRRNEVLTAMRKAHDITAAQYRAAIASPLGLRPGRRYELNRAPSFSGYALSEIARRFGRNAGSAGLRVQTTLYPRMQHSADAAIAGWLRQPSDPAAALVAIDPRSGAVRAMSTGVPTGQHFRFNLATQSRRQAGSAFKMFTLAAALQQGISLSSIWNGPPSLTIPDPRCRNADGPWVVHNFADEKAGTMDLASATAHSVNTIFAQVALRVGPDRVAQMAHRLGVKSPLRPVCSLTLGPEGVSPLEMTDAFATIAAGGVRHPAQTLQDVTGPDGALLQKLRTRGKRVLSRAVAARVTYALSGVVRGGTGTAADPGRPAAGKTGTAENTVDAWFCGYVPQLAACVWMGYPASEIPMHDVEGFEPIVGGSIPARIWHDFMVAALQRTPVRSQPEIGGSQLNAISGVGRGAPTGSNGAAGSTGAPPTGSPGTPTGSTGAPTGR
jgi:penicillin-binding protein 1A